MSKSQDSFFFFGTLCRSLQCIPCLSHVSPPPLRVRRPCRGCEAAPGSWTSGPWAPRGSSPGLRLVQFMAQLCSAMVLNLAKKETTRQYRIVISSDNNDSTSTMGYHGSPSTIPQSPWRPHPTCCLRRLDLHFLSSVGRRRCASGSSSRIFVG
jgi:hypothetical protein